MNMDVLEILDEMEETLNNSKTIPMMNKTMIDRDEFLKMVQDMRLSLPDNIKNAEWVANHKQEILMEAQKQSDVILSEAEKKIKLMVDENEIAKMAKTEADNIKASAQKNAKEIRLGSKEYADAIMEKLENDLANLMDTVKKNRDELKNS
jgi:cell division septum initiation protein DivIVA